VEEQFYFAWPAALAALLAWRIRRRWVAGLALLGVVLSAGWRSILWLFSVPVARLYFGTDTHVDGLLVGCLLAMLAAWGKGPRAAWPRQLLRWAAWPALAFLAAHGLSQTHPPVGYLFTYGFTLVAVATAVVIGALLWSPPSLLTALLASPPFRWLGRISYGTYLWNLPVMIFLPRLFGALEKPADSGDPLARVVMNVVSYDPRVTGALMLAGSLLAGALSYSCVERPFLRLKQRLKSGHVPPTRPAARNRVAA